MKIEFFDSDPKIEKLFIKKNLSNKSIINQYKKTIELLSISPPFANSLKKHKIVSKIENLFSVSINKKHRILFIYNEITEPNTIYIIEIGGHEVYKFI